jgi:hypothetical protein
MNPPVANGWGIQKIIVKFCQFMAGDDVIHFYFFRLIYFPTNFLPSASAWSING